MPDDNSELVPPDPIPNSEVKPLSADGSVGSPHVRVGHRQALIGKCPHPLGGGIFFCFGSSRPLCNVLKSGSLTLQLAGFSWAAFFDFLAPNSLPLTRNHRFILRRITEYLRRENWFVVILEWVAVVVGLFFAFRNDRSYELQWTNSDLQTHVVSLAEDFAV